MQKMTPIESVIWIMDSLVRDELTKTERKVAEALVYHGLMKWKPCGSMEILEAVDNKLVLRKEHGRRNLRWFWVYDVNCDCAAYQMVRLSAPRSGTFMRCQTCRKRLGDFSIRRSGKYKASNSTEAILMAREDWKRRQECPAPSKP